MVNGFPLHTMKKETPKPPSSPFPNFFSSLANYLPSSKADLFQLIAVLSIATVVAVTCNFIATSFDRHQKPFCDTTTSDYEDFSSVYCETCPENGVCHDGKLECKHGYRKQENLCIEDRNVNETAKRLSKLVEVRVCEACAEFSCTGKGNCWVSEYEMWNSLHEYKSKDIRGPDGAIFMLAKQRTMETIRNLLEARRKNYDVEEFKCPDLLVKHYKPLSCSVRHWITAHALLLVPACALFVGCILIVTRVYRRHQLSVRAEQLYHEVCDILEEKPLIARSTKVEGDPCIVASWLRDHLLSPKERKDPLLWKKVEALIQEDSRVDQYPKLVKGETKVVWEWQVEGSVSSLRKKRSFGSAHKVKENGMTSNLRSRMYAVA